MHVFTFDPNEHRYFLDGVEIPGVTTVLKEAGMCPTYDGFSDSTYRGLHVHLATEYLDLNDLDWRTVHPSYVGYVQAYERFKKDTGFTPELIEYQSYHPVFRFAGTLDRRGRFPDHEGYAIGDLKTGAEEDWHRHQTAGYQVLGQEAWAKDRRFSLYLNPDGTYRLAWHADPNDVRVFLAALTLAHYKRSRR